MDRVIIETYIDNESRIHWRDLGNMRKIILVSVGILSLLLCACTSQNNDSAITPKNIRSTEGETNMLTIDDIISDIPKNAAYRKTILQSYPSGGESRWDIFYDEHDNEICNICTSDILNHPDQDFAVSADSPFRTDTFYIYNADGMMLKRTIRFMDEVRGTRFEYNSDQTVARELQFKNNISGSAVSYEYDDHNNPVKAHHFIDDDIVHTDEYEYKYDENGRITYKVWKSRLFEEQIIHYYFEYDEHGNMTMKKEFREGADVPSYEKNYYDDNNRLIRCEIYLNDELLSESVFEYELYN